MMDERTRMHLRLWVVGVLLGLGLLGAIIRLLYVQTVQGAELRRLGAQQAHRYVSIPARRGAIYDRAGRLLATAELRYRVAVDPKAPRFGERAEDLYRHLGRLLGRKPELYRERVRRAAGARYVVLEPELLESQARELDPSRWPGLILERFWRRVYPYQGLAEHVLGYVDAAGRGMAGVEAYYEVFLRGEPGRRLVRRDRHGHLRPVIGASELAPRHGQELVLTIDLRQQAILEDELAEGVQASGAEWGMAILMDPHSGAIRGWSVYPGYDPNRPAAFPAEWRRNRAITDPVEPGSTFKLVTAMAALERGIVRPERVFTAGGVRTFGGRVMSDPEPWGQLTFAEAFARSSNIVLAQMAGQLGSGALYQMARNLGFGSPTGIDLPGEVSGRLKKPHQWSGTTLYWMAIGYEVAVTPLQLLCAYAAAANGGWLVRPFVVSERREPNGGRRWITRPRLIRRVCSPQTASTLRLLLEGVVEEGTGKRARLAELSVAGKTGTAKVVSGGRYEAQYRAAFVGFFPARDPQAVLLVMIGHPQGAYYAGEVAAPVFQRIVYRLVGAMPGVQQALSLASGGPSEDLRIPAPNVLGLPIEQARARCEALGLRLEPSQARGWVLTQAPAPGAPLSPGATLRIRAGVRPSLTPDVVGWPLRWAVEAFESSGARVLWSGWGRVVSQDPRPGRPLSAVVRLVAQPE
ncbi:MAG: penicillin-binding transpeptidase domain-containing protein [Bacteroidetes bacterium]|nr:penicillin-binding transpeptidase domain-containing protein [Bacteroidota bacterium]